MAIGLLGQKIGMTRVFEDGVSIPVSVIKVHRNRISQIKTDEIDGYLAVQLTGGTKKLSRLTKSLTGHFKKAEIEAGDMVAEFRVPTVEDFKLGQEIKVADVFTKGQYVDVTGISKGKGFAGTVKRHNFRTQDATHGNSRSHRVPGSIGQNQTPGRVFKGKKMAGHMGNEQCTVQTLQVVSVDEARDLILVKGGIPGAPGSKIKIKPAVKVQRGAK